MYCTSNLKQLGLALHSYHDARQRFPSGVITSGDDFRDGMHSGFTLLLPHLEESSLHRAYDFASNWRSENNLSVAQNRLDVLLCPSSGNVVPQDGGAAGAPADYAFCKGSVAFLCSQPAGGGMFDINSRVRIKAISDGTSHTLAMGEAASSPDLLAAST